MVQATLHWLPSEEETQADGRRQRRLDRPRASSPFTHEPTRRGGDECVPLDVLLHTPLVHAAVILQTKC